MIIIVQFQILSLIVHSQIILLVGFFIIIILRFFCIIVVSYCWHKTWLQLVHRENGGT